MYILRRPQNFAKSPSYFFWLQFLQVEISQNIYGLLRTYELYRSSWYVQPYYLYTVNVHYLEMPLSKSIFSIVTSEKKNVNIVYFISFCVMYCCSLFTQKVYFVTCWVPNKLRDTLMFWKLQMLFFFFAN